MNELKQQIKKANAPILLCDFSDEAIELLSLKIPVLIFRETLDPRLVTEMVTKYDLTAYFYKPFEVRGTTLFYSVAGQVLPLTGRPCKPGLVPHFPWDFVISPSTFPIIEGVYYPMRQKPFALAA